MGDSLVLVVDVFEPGDRGGLLVTCLVEGVEIKEGTWLALADNPEIEVKVLGVDFSTEQATIEKKVTFLVSSDLAGLIQPGVRLYPAIGLS